MTIGNGDFGSRIDPADLVGLTEIADRLNTTTAAVANWTKRDRAFPAPVVELACGRLYLWSQVRPWADSRTDRTKRVMVTVVRDSLPDSGLIAGIYRFENGGLVRADTGGSGAP